jgi:chromosome segregation ATPase
MPNNESHLNAYVEQYLATEIVALRTMNAEVRRQLAVQTEIAAQANERIIATVREQSKELGDEREKLGVRREELGAIKEQLVGKIAKAKEQKQELGKLREELGEQREKQGVQREELGAPKAQLVGQMATVEEQEEELKMLRDELEVQKARLGGTMVEIEGLKAALGPKDSKIAQLEKLCNDKEEAFRGFQGELRKIREAVRRSTKLAAAFNRGMVGVGIGLGLVGLGCCPTFELKGYSEQQKKAANGAITGVIIGGEWDCWALHELRMGFVQLTVISLIPRVLVLFNCFSFVFLLLF